MNRMKLWRVRKTSQEAGRQTQVCVWAPEQDAELVRDICSRVAEATSRGADLRGALTPQIGRRRTIFGTWRGTTLEAEVDYPLVGPWWSMRNIGGRIHGSDGTHIELTPGEAHHLKDRLSRACQAEITSWLESHKEFGRVHDNTGVVTDETFLGTTGGKDPDRPQDEAAFAASEAKIAQSVAEAAAASRNPCLEDPSVVEYEGAFGFPSFCQIAHRRQGDRIQFALIHTANGGTSPTNMFASLATYMRQQFYKDVDAGRIDWYDVIPAGVHHTRRTEILPVTMEHSNGIYSKPEWSPGTTISTDWRAFINETVMRGQTARSTAEAAPQVDSGKKKRVAR